MLVKLFVSSLYSLYFANLALITLLLVKRDTLFKTYEKALFLSLIPVIYFVYQYYKENIYYFTLDLDITDTINYIDSEISFLLILIHTFILFFIQYKTNR